jgi:hypothetical protein
VIELDAANRLSGSFHLARSAMFDLAGKISLAMLRTGTTIDGVFF